MKKHPWNVKTKPTNKGGVSVKTRRHVSHTPTQKGGHGNAPKLHSADGHATGLPGKGGSPKPRHGYVKSPKSRREGRLAKRLSGAHL
jgi:hypothetical protein